MQPEKRKEYSSYLQTAALFLIVTGLPLSVFLMSLGGISLLLAVILQGEYKKQWGKIRKNALFFSITGIFFLHLIGLIYTEDFAYAFKDIKVKIPLLLFPLAFFVLPKPSDRIIRVTLNLFIAAVVIATFIAYLVYLRWIPVSRDISEPRHIVLFISHIRLSLLICIAISVLLYRSFFKKESGVYLSLLLTVWFLYFFYILESVTGVAVFLSVIFTLILIFIFRNSNKYFRIGISLLLVSSIVLIVFSSVRMVRNYYTPKENLENLETVTDNGNPYHHDLNNLKLENGYYVGIYQSREELIPAWNERSSIPFDSLDKKGQEISHTIIRYLTSKGLRKDKNGVEALSEDDIVNIENGIANVNYLTKSGLQRRLEQILFEFDVYFNSENPAGNSVTQRFVFWNTGWKIFRENALVGIGTGDVQRAFDQQYEKDNSLLPEQNRLRAHNQFLTFMLTFGIVGLVFFLISIFVPLIVALKESNYLYLLFFVVAFLSFFTEDTLETQAGVTFFAFFNCFFLFYKEDSSKD